MEIAVPRVWLVAGLGAVLSLVATSFFGFLGEDPSFASPDSEATVAFDGQRMSRAGVDAVGASQQIDSELSYAFKGSTRTSSSRWSGVPIERGTCKGDVERCNFAPVLVRTSGRLSLAWSGVVRGGPIEIRVLDRGASGTDALLPGIVRFDGGGARSFTFVSRDVRTDGCQGIEIQWRSLSGKAATVTDTTTVIRYEDSGRTESLGCA